MKINQLSPQATKRLSEAQIYCYKHLKPFTDELEDGYLDPGSTFFK